MNAPTNPFSGDVVIHKPSGALTPQAHTESQRAIAEVQAAMMIARANPRDPIAAMDRILNACTRPTLAERALYTYSRGGTEITGPSIRLAEAVAQQWGNIQFGIRELDQRGDMSTVQAFAWDVETNTRREVTFQVQLVRHTKKGAYRLEDPRDIYEMVANQGARRVRACILSVIPGDVIESAVAQCDVTLRAKADTSPETLQKMVEAFGEYGVSKEQIEKRIQRRLDTIQPAQVISLKKIFVSLRDGMSVAADWFDLPEPAAGDAPAPSTKTEGIKGRLKAKVETETTPAPEERLPAPAGAVPETGEVTQELADVEVGPPEAMEAGRVARREGKARRVPQEFQISETLSNAFLEGWNAEDEEIAEAKKAKK